MGKVELDSWFADAVIVAAGSSVRMAGMDKLLEPLNGQPLLQWSVEALSRAESVAGVFVVVRPDRVDEFRRFPWLDGIQVIAGGKERSDSVRAGLAKTTARVVLVHDGARPLVSVPLIDAVAKAASEHGAALPALPLSDALKRTAGSQVVSALDRTGLVRAQTPQAARRDLLAAAFEKAGDKSFPDEAELLDAVGVPVVTVPGDPSNVKVTDRADLEMVRALARGRSGERIGFGEDIHSFGPADGLMLGGIEIAEAPRLYGHSDGDVVMHAVATAVLSACGLGDIGRLFPANDPDTTGISGMKLLAMAVGEAEAVGWSVDHAHVSIVGARPRLGARRLDAMRRPIATILGLPRDESVAVVASTGNLSGPEGEGRAIRATALVTVVRR